MTITCLHFKCRLSESQSAINNLHMMLADFLFNYKNERVEEKR